MVWCVLVRVVEELVTMGSGVWVVVLWLFWSLFGLDLSWLSEMFGG